MISIIVSSYKADLFKTFSKSVEDTVGIQFEIIKIENPGLMGICEAYNKGADQAKYDYLVFCHEDVLFYTNDWGQSLIKPFKEDIKLGILGVAGSKIKSNLPTGWTTGLQEYDFFYLNQYDRDGKVKKVQNWSGDTRTIDVKVLDGVFLMTKKSVWQEFKFDSNNSGFHFYDLEFTLRVSEKYKCCVSKDVLLAHFSKGNFGEEWVKSCIEFNNNNTVNRDLLNKKILASIRNFWFYRLMVEEISITTRIRYITSMGFRFGSMKSAIRFLLNF